MSFEPLLKVKAKRNARCIEMPISEQNIKDQIAIFLQQMNVIRDTDELIDLDFGTIDKEKLVPLKIYLKKEVSKVSGKSQKKEGLP